MPQTATASNSQAVLADELAVARTALRNLIAAVKYERNTRGTGPAHTFCAVPGLDRAMEYAKEVLGA